LRMIEDLTSESASARRSYSSSWCVAYFTYSNFRSIQDILISRFGRIPLPFLGSNHCLDLDLDVCVVVPANVHIAPLWNTSSSLFPWVLRPEDESVGASHHFWPLTSSSRCRNKTSRNPSKHAFISDAEYVDGDSSQLLVSLRSLASPTDQLLNRRRNWDQNHLRVWRGVIRNGCRILLLCQIVAYTVQEGGKGSPLQACDASIPLDYTGKGLQAGRTRWLTLVEGLG